MSASIATANSMTRGEVNATLIKVADLMGVDDINKAAKMLRRGGHDIVRAKILQIFGSVTISATTETFLASEKFRLDSEEVKFHCDNFRGSFQGDFLSGVGRIGDSCREGYLKCRYLVRVSDESLILEALGGELQARVDLVEFYEVLREQGNGEEGGLATNGDDNLFFIRNTMGIPRRVSARWYKYGWILTSSPVKPSNKWRVGTRVFSRNS